MSKSQRINRHVTKLDYDFVLVEYDYLYVDEKEEVERKLGDIKGYHPIGKTIHINLKHCGKPIGWVWKQMYQKDENKAWLYEKIDIREEVKKKEFYLIWWID